MMRSWVVRNAKSIVIGSATISIVTHIAVITGWVIGTLPDPILPEGSIANRVFYIPPPDRVATQHASRERVQYITLNQFGAGTGEGPRQAGNDATTSLDETIGHEMPATKDSVNSDAADQSIGEDSVYSVLEVDTAVVRSSSSAAPVYPPALLAAHVQGYVNAQYVVDTTGFADTVTFQVMESTNPEFTAAVRRVLPLMRFQPAKIGPLKVRQLVQQQFSFKITGDTIAATPPPKRP
jgi:outer membrane biosynthesis protein TonB